MEIIVREVLKLSENFVFLSDSSQGRNITEAVIKTVKPQLEKSLGASKSQEIGDLLVSMSAVLEESFAQIKSRLDEKESNIVNSIK
jgi:hypothetical protein